MAMLSVPEIVLYGSTFCWLIKNTKRTELAGILKPEVMKRRRQKNALNIAMTFWAWLAQFVSNIMYIIVIKLFFGKLKFHQALFSILTISQVGKQRNYFCFFHLGGIH
jgi:hypothetical protein